MSYNCAKCNTLDKNVTMFVEGGVGYLFCKSCADLLEQLPTGTIHDFLGPKKETWIEKNIRKACKRRANGELLWK